MSRSVVLLLIFALFAFTFAEPGRYINKHTHKNDESGESDSGSQEDDEGSYVIYTRAKADHGSIGVGAIKGGKFDAASFSIGHGGTSSGGGDGGHGGNQGTNSYGGPGGDAGHTSYGG